MGSPASADSGQTWDPRQYAATGRFVSDLAQGVFELLAPVAGERILDLGCGDGALTAKIADAGATVLGVDSSPGMVRAAQERGLDARVMDGEALPFSSEFDAVFSNAALHWMRDHRAVLEGVRLALKPGGRFVAEMGGFGNIAAIRTALSAVMKLRGLDAEQFGSNYFPTPDQYRGQLIAAGFQVEQIELIPRPTALPETGMRGWLETFRNGLLDRLAANDRESVIAEAVSLLQPILRTEDGRWFADYVRLRFRAMAA